MLRGESAVGEASVGQIKKQVPLLKDEAVTNYIDRIGKKIANASGREEFDYQFHVVMDDTLNAFALPGGKIFVNAGAIMKTDSEAELAGLLAHEVSHSALSHGFQLVTKGNLTANVISYVPYVGNTASSLIVLNYSRGMEKQADVFGTRILVNAGYAADGVRNLMAQLHESHQDEDNPEPPAWLSSHPNTEQRIAYMERLIVDNNLNRYAYEGVDRHQEIKQLVKTQWQKYEECAEDIDSIEEAKVCAGEIDEKELPEESSERVEEAEEAQEAEEVDWFSAIRLCTQLTPVGLKLNSLSLLTKKTTTYSNQALSAFYMRRTMRLCAERRVQFVGGVPPLKEARHCGLARQSVAEVPSVEGTVEGGGSPHEQVS